MGFYSNLPTNLESMNQERQSQPAVRAWEEQVIIPTYPAPAPDKNPMFLDRRVYQGSSGKVYPNPFTDRVSDQKVDKPYRAVFLENEYIRLMILPEIGGRIHIGFDKSNNYDFFYRQRVIKPALVGLLGPWISGGVEFNWPQHHRPSTFMPVDYLIEEHRDGSRTLWLSEHEPMNRMKGMVGICLHPGKAVVEARVRLYNRTPFAQTFLWWANVAVHVHDQYQAFFPPDVEYVADHAKRAVSSFPVAHGFYYGVDYSEGVDITWYKNISVPTSYMVTRSNYDFIGGYDHKRKAGLVHVADHHIAPGKKLWTWGNHEFGYAWDRELTDSDGPYVELMAGVYTDNQPDFSWLQPYETRSFSQYWYPIQEIGPVKNANALAAVNLERNGNQVTLGLCVTERLGKLDIVLSAGDEVVFRHKAVSEPGRPWTQTLTLRAPCAEPDLLLRVLSGDGCEIIRYRPEQRTSSLRPQPASEPPVPAEIGSSEELYLIGLHLEQYRHATRSPEPYWEEVLRRDRSDMRANNAMGLRLLHRGLFHQAEAHFRVAAERLTQRNPNPYDGEPYYNLGLALRYQERWEEATDAFYKATWNSEWRAAGHYALAAIDCRRGGLDAALSHLERSLASDPDHLKARDLKAAILRRLGRNDEALALLCDSLRMDPLDHWAQYEELLAARGRRPGDSAKELVTLVRGDVQTCLDLAFDYGEAGLWSEAIDVLSAIMDHQGRGAYPMCAYGRGFFMQNSGDLEGADESYRQGAVLPPDYCFPARLEEMRVLESVLEWEPDDARAQYYLGNLLYDKGRAEDAILHWQCAVALEPGFSIPWRNLGVAICNHRRDLESAARCYAQAFEVNPADARLLYEFDQLLKRMGTSPRARLERLEQHGGLVEQRDDLTVELATLYNQLGRAHEALNVLTSRRFHPWEGGEGVVSGQYVLAHLILGRTLLESGRGAEALAHFEAARVYPPNLGEGKHLLTLETHLDYFSGLAFEQMGRVEESQSCWWKAADLRTGAGLMGYYQALALRKLGREQDAALSFEQLLEASQEQVRQEVKVDYFATSLPNFLLFEDDLQRRNRVECLFLAGLAKLGLGRRGEAASDLRQVLSLDVNHVWAQEELKRVEAPAHASPISQGS